MTALRVKWDSAFVVGYDFGHAFECGLDLILDALEHRRERP
jgi:hypothetical protein